MIQRSHQTQRLLSIGMIAIGFTIAISSFGIVRAEHAKPDSSKTYSCSSGTACVEGNSSGSSTYGVYGVGSAADGVRGVTTTSGGGNGVIGIASGTSSTANGVYGGSTNADGVEGQSAKGYGVVGKSSSDLAGVYGTSTSYGYGVQGYSSSYVGVYGQSTGSTGVDGYSAGGSGGLFENDSDAPTLVAQADEPNGYPLNVFAVDETSSKITGEFSVDGDGDGVFTGSVTGTNFIKDQQERGGPRVEAFSPESTRATIEDTGTARLEGGEGAVRFDSAFAGTIDAARGYQVFLTPDGETRGWLYVAVKYEGGFIVREAERGRSSVYFDYRVVAHPYGASDARLPQLSLKPPPIPHLPRHVAPPQLPQP